MKKPNEKANAFLNITPAEEQLILLDFERFVANYENEDISNKSEMKTSKKINWLELISRLTSSTPKFVSLLFFLFTFCSPIFSQNENTWIGGTPGQESNWHCPKNWSDYKVPDEFSDVQIINTSTTTFAYPIIESGTVEINSIQVELNASLTIQENAQMIVVEKIENILKENIIANGSLMVVGDLNNEQLHANAKRNKRQQ